MNRRPRPKKRANPAGRMFLLLVVVVACVLLGWRLISPLFQRTAVVQAGSAGGVYEVDAVVVRNETLTDAEGAPTTLYFADEGNVVHKGDKIAAVYSAGYSQPEVNKLDNIRQQIRQYHQEVVLTSYSDPQLERLDDDVRARAQEIKLLIQRRSAGSLLNLQRQLTLALGSRQTYLRQKYPNDNRLLRLYSDEASQQKKIEAWTITYIAQKQAIVSFYTDGYEAMLSGTTIADLTPADVRGILAGQQPERTAAQKVRTPIYRTVEQSGWYLLALSTNRDWNPVEGQGLTVQLEGYDGEGAKVNATVQSFVRIGGDLLVRLQVAGSVREVLSTRATRATIAELYNTGLQVPANAIIPQGGQQGVVLTDGNGIFVPVYVLQTNNKVATVQPVTEGTLRPGQKIRLF